MFLSYLVTCHNETRSLNDLLSKLYSLLKPNHEIVIVDDYSDSPETLKILDEYQGLETITIQKHKLDNNYSAQKNFGIDQCKGDWIFQLDADELPTDELLENIDAILEANDANEVIWLPRCNKFIGVTQKDIDNWGWHMHNGMVNFPDYQSRIYKNLPYIRYQRRLHERVEGYKSYVMIPPQEELAIIHTKTIEKQRENNHNYMKNFTMAENMGGPIH